MNGSGIVAGPDFGAVTPARRYAFSPLLEYGMAISRQLIPNFESCGDLLFSLNTHCHRCHGLTP